MITDRLCTRCFSNAQLGEKVGTYVAFKKGQHLHMGFNRDRRQLMTTLLYKCKSKGEQRRRMFVVFLLSFSTQKLNFISVPRRSKEASCDVTERQRQRPSSGFSRKHLYPVIRRLMWFHGDSVMNSPCDTVKCFIPVLWEIPAGTALCKHPWWFMQCHWIQGGILDDEVIWLCWKQRALMKVFVICVWVSAQHRLFGHRW